MKRIHFISGLPRSGSTLLAAILRQNPRFHAAMSGPVAGLIAALQVNASAGEYSGFIDNTTRARLLRGVFESYYGDIPEDAIIFDTNRSWTGRVPLLSELFPESKIICCVRDLGWIVNSIEALLRRNPLQLSRIFECKPMMSAYARAEYLMNAERGLIGVAWNTLREAWFGELASRLIVISYDRLVTTPMETLQRLYAELQEQYYPHNFDDVHYEESRYDSFIGLPELHKVRRKVAPVASEPVIPPDLFTRYKDRSFWKQPDANRNGVVML
jgi:sulfotransferase